MATRYYRAGAVWIGRLILFAAAFVVLSDRLSLGLLRFFDADEFAFFHWAHNLFTGSVPVRDFILYTPPGLEYLLFLVFYVWGGVTPFLVGRVGAWLVYVGMGVLLGGILYAVRFRGEGEEASVDPFRYLILPGVLLAAMAIPSDKLLEVRPDNLAALLALGGVLLEVRALDRMQRGREAYWSGVLYAASVLVLPKTVPTVAVGMGLYVWVWLTARGAGRSDRGRMVLQSIAGAAVPSAVMLLWVVAVSRGWATVEFIWYSLVRMPFEVNRIGEVFAMQPDLFFYPNAVYYGLPGWNWLLIVNHGIWLLGLLTGAFRLVTPFLPRGRRGVWGEVFVAFVLFANIVTFLYGYPLRHEQYLIPIALLVALYAADAAIAVVSYFERISLFQWLGKGILAAVVVVAVAACLSGSAAKRRSSNIADLETISRMLRLIPEGSYVFDLVGTTTYYRDPYVATAVPFGQWEPYLSRPLPDLIPALTRTGTRYIYEGALGRVSTLSAENQAFIREYFIPYGDTIPGLLVKR